MNTKRPKQYDKDVLEKACSYFATHLFTERQDLFKKHWDTVEDASQDLFDSFKNTYTTDAYELAKQLEESSIYNISSEWVYELELFDSILRQQRDDAIVEWAKTVSLPSPEVGDWVSSIKCADDIGVVVKNNFEMKQSIVKFRKDALRETSNYTIVGTICNWEDLSKVPTTVPCDCE